MVISLSTATRNPDCKYSSLKKVQTCNKGQGEIQAALLLFQLLAIFAEFNLARRTMCTTESDLQLKRKNGNEIKRKNPAPHKTFAP